MQKPCYNSNNYIADAYEPAAQLKQHTHFILAYECSHGDDPNTKL